MSTTLIAELRRGIATSDAHRRAAVELLIKHDFWLRRPDFVTAAVRGQRNDRYIAWSAARTAFDAGEFDRSSTTERNVLNLAIALGEDLYGLSMMGAHHGPLVAEAFTAAATGR